MRIQGLIFGFNLRRGSAFDSRPCSLRQNLRCGRSTGQKDSCAFCLFETGIAISVTTCQLLKIFPGIGRKTLEFQMFGCHIHLFGRPPSGKGSPR